MKGKRRGMVRELEAAMLAGKDEVLSFIERHSIPEPNTGCWLWEGPIGERGYGYIVDPRKPIHRQAMPRIRVHRLACEMLYGTMEPGIDARHLCHNPGCVSPAHLLPGSRQENINDSVRAGRWTFTRGEANGRAKLSKSDVSEIRATFKRHTSGEAARFAKRYGISESLVRQIARHAIWNSDHAQ